MVCFNSRTLCSGPVLEAVVPHPIRCLAKPTASCRKTTTWSDLHREALVLLQRSGSRVWTGGAVSKVDEVSRRVQSVQKVQSRVQECPRSASPSGTARSSPVEELL
ncbi:unnamed protein product [Merluccius merluccius]